MSEDRLTLWMFDFDGTLSAFVADRRAAKLERNCRRMLVRLAAVSGFRCAVLSSRHLSDLISRVNVPGLFLGGSSGLEWRLPDGRRRFPGDDYSQLIERKRKAVLPELMGFSRLLGLDLEDKYWSVAIHTRGASDRAKKDLAHLAARWRRSRGVTVLRGTEVIEVQLLPHADKSYGVRAFCDLVGFRPGRDGLRYAGDDENDLLAMRTVKELGGNAVTVGNAIVVPFANSVASPRQLAEHICASAGLPPNGVSPSLRSMAEGAVFSAASRQMK